MSETQLNSQIIMSITPEMMFSDCILDELYDIDDELTRARIKGQLKVRAKELKISKEFEALLKAYEQANQKLADEYTRLNAQNLSNLSLQFDSKGKPAETIENFLFILREDERFLNVRFNLLSHAPEFYSCDGVRVWEDADDASTRNYIEKKYKLYNPTKMEDALRILFKERSYHPIKDIIEAQKWDGIERIPTLLTKWLKCEDSLYTREISRLIFAGGINRLYNNGCKFDEVPILIGTKQGEGKSTFVRWLALRDEFFAEITEIEGQKGIEAVSGAWICEISELLALTRAKEVEAVKSYMTRLVDTYRVPFDKRPSKFKRQCVFIGTTNKERFLTDLTGNRRFYPVKVNQSGYDLFHHQEEAKADILMCWAEAKTKFDRGEMLPFADRGLLDEIKEHQANAVEDDYRIGQIQAYLENRVEICLLELWQKALDNPYLKPSRKDSNDLSLILQSMDGWVREEKSRRDVLYGVQKFWVKAEGGSIPYDAENDLPFRI